MTQKQDFDLRLFLPYLLNQAAEASSLSFQQVYKNRYGMLRAEWRVLFHLGVYGPLTAKQICDRTKMHKTKISRAVQKLADRRYLKRDRSENDRRSEILMLTERGQAVYRELNGIAQDYEADLLASFSSTERDVLKQLLIRLANGSARNDP